MLHYSNITIETLLFHLLCKITNLYIVYCLYCSLCVNRFVPLEPMHQYFAPDIAPQSSIDYLRELCTSFEPFYVFTYDTFMPLHPYQDDSVDQTSHDSNRAQKFERMLKISLSELRAQISYDLVNFYLYTKQYKLAQDAARECRDNLFRTRQEYASQGKGSKQFVFCQINETELEGYLLACGVGMKQPSLMERFNSAALTQYQVIAATFNHSLPSISTISILNIILRYPSMSLDILGFPSISFE